MDIQYAIDLARLLTKNPQTNLDISDPAESFKKSIDVC